jgi:glycosyltransferase involved in cell wall biosynthesis
MHHSEIQRYNLSIIVPITQMKSKLGNLEKWISEATSEKIQIILIHDDQNDGTQEELEALVKKHHGKQVQLYRHKCGSPGEARNKGTSFARGEWIVFWDSDDIPNLKQVLECMSSINLSQVDLIIGAYNVEDSVTKELCNVIQPNDLNLSLLAINPGIWRYIFRKSLIINNSFNSLLMGEDQIFLSSLPWGNMKVYLSNLNFYTYMVNQKNQATLNKKSQRDILKARNILKDNFFSSSHSAKSFISMLYLRQTITSIRIGNNIERTQIILTYLKSLLNFHQSFNLYQIKSIKIFTYYKLIKNG